MQFDSARSTRFTAAEFFDGNKKDLAVEAADHFNTHRTMGSLAMKLAALRQKALAV
jgi:hypothetical protein